MNEAHQVCGSEEWREIMRDVVFPWALGDASLGNDVLEVGPGYGATTDVLSTMTARLTSVEVDEQLAAMLQERFAATPSVRIVRADATALNFQNEKFTGAACFTMLHHVPTTEMQDRLLSEIARVLRPGAPLVVSDSIGSEELEALHNDDTYNPIDPAEIKDRLAGAGSPRFRFASIPRDGRRWATRNEQFAHPREGGLD
ncbi:class I SAM-dependent methyltransferase [Mycobacterium sp. MAA66]|uniref:class I SAM-dependent methyltransferase n=1 Tax=Mycobacterium sp. MAA66 TaxID=3156297 RepID=UPI003519C771